MKSIESREDGSEVVTLTIGPAQRGQAVPVQVFAVYLTEEPEPGADAESLISRGPNGASAVPDNSRGGIDVPIVVGGVPDGTFCVQSVLKFA